MKDTIIILLISYVWIWFLIILFSFIIYQSELKLVNRNLKFQIVDLLQENNPELEGEHLKEKVNEIYNIVSGK